MKKLIIGLVIGLMLGMSSNAFAAIGDSVQAVFAEFNYVVNGNSVAIDSPILVYEGTSYVRTTQIANMLGYDVTYKSDSRTIEFNKPEQTSTPVQTNTPAQSTPNPTPTPTPTPTTAGTIANPMLNPNAIPVPTDSPITTPTPTPTPIQTNASGCQDIKNNYGYQIAMVEYESGAEGPKRNKVLLLQYEEKNALAAAGCN